MPTLQEKQKFERYRIIRWLGNGTSGESYEAEDTILLRKVTLKLIHPWATLTDAARRQFFREMQDISLLNHPYIAQVLDYGEIDRYLYIVRRYVSSGSLLSNDGRLWYRPPLANADAIRYTIQLAQALEHIHTQGYVHGALTFTNVLVLRTFDSEQTANFAPFLLAD
ncbi:MAG TPA: protein kinase, partial [Ktedonobacteraceae bacterium]|nr:protein kinase [Ktedonobacteraceae bacterium]